MYRLGPLVFVAFLTSCAAHLTLTAAETKDCESFSDVDAAVRAELDRLLASAPGDELVKEASRLNLARRACARHRLAVLREVRERDGVEVIQHELDALTRTYGADELRRLVVEQFGPEADQLIPLLAEAKQRAAREGSTAKSDRLDDDALKGLAVDGPSRVGAEPKGPDTLCDAPTPCEQLRCVANEGGNVDPPARACLDSLEKLGATTQAARGVAAVLSVLPPGVSGTRTEASLKLEALRQATWPRVEKERAAGHPGLAAELASPFSSIAAVAAEVEKLRDAAQAHHLARAKALSQWPDASWLHARIAEQFGGPQLEAPAREGKWDSVRWRCPGEAPALPTLPAGLSATLSVRCEAGAKPTGTTTGGPQSDLLKTFELEKELRAQRVMGSLNVQCADRSSLFTVNADEADAVPRELSRLMEQLVSACINIHSFAATRSCTELRKKPAGELTARFVDHARFNQKWEPCFVEWLATEEGASPPPLPRPPLER